MLLIYCFKNVTVLWSIKLYSEMYHEMLLLELLPWKRCFEKVILNSVYWNWCSENCVLKVLLLKCDSENVNAFIFWIPIILRILFHTVYTMNSGLYDEHCFILLIKWVCYPEKYGQKLPVWWGMKYISFVHIGGYRLGGP